MPSHRPHYPSGTGPAARAYLEHRLADMAKNHGEKIAQTQLRDALGL